MEGKVKSMNHGVTENTEEMRFRDCTGVIVTTSVHCPIWIFSVPSVTPW